MGDFARPTQSQPKITQTDPFKNMPVQSQMTQDALRGALFQNRGSLIGNPYAAPSGMQTQALNDLQGYTQASMPAFRDAAGLLNRTAGGAYLDPTRTQQYQNMKNTQMTLANMLFGQQAGQMASNAAARNAQDTGAFRTGLYGAAEQRGSQTGQGVATRGFGLYGQERGRMEDAAAKGMTLAPMLAGQVFGNEETIRAAQQQGNVDQMRASLQAMGLDQGSIEAMLQYMDASKAKAVPYVKGPSPLDLVNQTVQNWAPMMGGKPGASPTPSPNPGARGY